MVPGATGEWSPESAWSSPWVDMFGGERRLTGQKELQSTPIRVWSHNTEGRFESPTLEAFPTGNSHRMGGVHGHRTDRRLGKESESQSEMMTGKVEVREGGEGVPSLPSRGTRERIEQRSDEASGDPPYGVRSVRASGCCISCNTPPTHRGTVVQRRECGTTFVPHIFWRTRGEPQRVRL